MARKRTGPTWKPTPQDLQDALLAQNPWWVDDRVPEIHAPPIERSLAALVERRIWHDEPRRFQIILGPRRVGKTTVLFQTVRHLLGRGIPSQRILWLRLDHPLLTRIPLGHLVDATIRERHSTPSEPLYLFLDELTYAEDWNLWLKTFYDEARPVRILGSSSSAAELRKSHYESGIGRWDEQYLAPYLFGEFLALLGKPIPIPIEANLADTLDACIRNPPRLNGAGEMRRRFLLTGGFPELLLPIQKSNQDETTLLLQSQQVLRNDAVERAIYKDIPQAYGLDSPRMLERLLYTLAGQIGGILSPKSICENLDGLSQPTFDRYLSYLIQSFLVFTLDNYSGSELATQKRGRKLYFVDGAVRNAALQRGTGPLNDTDEMGLLRENLLASHLHALSQQSQVRLYYWRDKNDEVDLIYDHPEKPLVFEIASSAGHHRKGLRALLARHKRFDGRCYLVYPDAVAVRPAESSDRIGTLPLDLLLLAVGAQAERDLGRRLQ